MSSDFPMATDPEDVPSPCIGVCTLIAPGQICRGCGRTIREIAAWTGLAPAEKQRVRHACPQRLMDLEQTSRVPDPPRSL
ncbi:hypothetical protein Pan44_12710 [Caulifigura coniformis]|uniref:Fe-S protein n=1 Tax=Caulifigura coniformis TaxID=2527983 RepID=A0A517SAW3_9PLAN|nr:DUF1289 domain-containing protein [Caulifigura coniformis]QDT53255.1 hypothetical protein Pan44_12710 [Caulifigura coniformis]